MDRVREGGPGLALLIVSAFLLLVWGVFVVRRRRACARLGITTLVLALGGYLVYDWQHLSLNCSMRDPQSVRDECVRLLHVRRATFRENESMELCLRGSDIPESLARLGAKSVRVSPENVKISLVAEDGLTGSAWGFLFDPKRASLAGRAHYKVRATWYHDFYEFEVCGE